MVIRTMSEPGRCGPGASGGRPATAALDDGSKVGAVLEAGNTRTNKLAIWVFS
jgi:hypothetical protein